MANTQQQRERSLLLQELIKLATTEQTQAAAKAAGLKDPRIAERIAETLHTHDSIYNPNPRGPKTRFTADVLETAYNILSDPGYESYTASRLRDKLIKDRKLDPPVDADNLLMHLKEYCREQGHVLLTTATGTVFEIKPANKSKRVEWCEGVQQLLKQHPMSSWIFEDEVEVEQDPHPKCEW